MLVKENRENNFQGLRILLEYPPMLPYSLLFWTPKPSGSPVQPGLNRALASGGLLLPHRSLDLRDLDSIPAIDCNYSSLRNLFIIYKDVQIFAMFLIQKDNISCFSQTSQRR
jgi:hypothetical protein